MHDYIQQGGIFIWPIILSSLWAFTLLFERLWFFKNAVSKFYRDSETEFQSLKNRNIYQVHESLKQSTSLAHEILRAGWDPAHKTLAAAERGIEEVIHKHIPILDKHLSTISTLAGIQTLLGLLGTITGMISVFAVITAEGGSVDASSLAGGISEAMITTQAGLCASIPIIIGHNFLRNRFKSVMAVVQSGSARALKELENHVAQ